MLRCNRLLHKHPAVLPPTAVLSRKLLDGSAEKEPRQELRFVPERGLRPGIKDSSPAVPIGLPFSHLSFPIWGLEAVESKEDPEWEKEPGLQDKQVSWAGPRNCPQDSQVPLSLPSGTHS